MALIVALWKTNKQIKDQFCHRGGYSSIGLLSSDVRGKRKRRTKKNKKHKNTNLLMFSM